MWHYLTNMMRPVLCSEIYITFCAFSHFQCTQHTSVQLTAPKIHSNVTKSMHRVGCYTLLIRANNNMYMSRNDFVFLLIAMTSTSSFIFQVCLKIPPIREQQSCSWMLGYIRSVGAIVVRRNATPPWADGWPMYPAQQSFTTNAINSINYLVQRHKNI